ncbi:MAG: hypothetical protein ACT4QA_06280 [Panacagrimonas sp.]
MFATKFVHRFTRIAPPIAGLILAASMPMKSLAGEVALDAVPIKVNTVSSNSQIQLVPSIAADADGDFAIAWVGNTRDNPAIRMRRYEASGTPITAEVTVATSSSERQVSCADVASDASGKFVVTWVDRLVDSGHSPRIFSQRFNANGSPNGSRFQLEASSPAVGINECPRVTMNTVGDFIVAWHEYDGYTYETGGGAYGGIFVRKCSSGGFCGPRTLIETIEGSPPQVAMAVGSDFVIVYKYDVYESVHARHTFLKVRRFDGLGHPSGPAHTIPLASGHGFGRYSVGLAADRSFVVAYQLNDNDTDIIVAHRFSAESARIDPPIEVAAEGTTDQSIGEVNMAVSPDGRFSVAWTLHGSSGGVRARRFSASGVPTADSSSLSLQSWEPAVALDADGDMVVAWRGYDSTVSGLPTGLYARRYQGPENVDLTVTQTDSADPAPIGKTLTYSVSVHNLHPPISRFGSEAIDKAIGTARSVRVQLSTPANSSSMSVQSTADWICSGGQLLNCTYKKPLPAGAAAPTILVSLKPSGPSGSTITNLAQVKADQKDASNGNNMDAETTRLVQ